jgi:hypothetical protein
MTRDEWEHLTSIVADAKRARKIANDADATLRFRLKELEDAVNALRPKQ